MYSIHRQSPIFLLLNKNFCLVIQLFIVFKQPVSISVTVFSNTTKLTNNLFILPIKIKQTYKPYTLVGPTVTRPVQEPLAVVNLNNRQFIFLLIFSNLIVTAHGIYQ